MQIFLDYFLTFVHLAVIGFNLFGWIWRRTRKVHLMIVVLTAASWFLLGIWFGWGYCFLTDWHWDVKRKLGETGLPNSFIKYFADYLAGMDLAPKLVDSWTLGIFIAVIVMTVWVNARRRSFRLQ